MKKIILGLILLGFATATYAIDMAELGARIHTLTVNFEALEQQPGKAIPADILRKAQGIVLLDRTKAGFLFAYQGGDGVALVKNAQTRQWSAPAFVGASDASLGFQLGGEQGFFVILLMDTNTTRLLSEPNFKFGGEARGTAGNASGGVEGTVSSPDQPVLVYSDRKGLFGGVALKGGAIAPDDKANRAYYGEYLTMQDILFDGKAQPTEAAAELAQTITDYSRRADFSQK